MNEAPSREPDSIVNASSFVIVPAPNRLIAVAATGEPESTKYAPSQPVPIVDTPFANGNCPSIDGPTAVAPDFISWIARMNRKIAGRNSSTFLMTYQGLRSTSNGPRSM